MGHTHPRPLTADVGPTAQQTPAEPPRCFVLAPHRFHEPCAAGVQGSARGGPPWRRQARLGGGGWLHLLSRRGMVALLPSRGGGRAVRATVRGGRQFGAAPVASGGRAMPACS